MLILEFLQLTGLDRSPSKLNKAKFAFLRLMKKETACFFVFLVSFSYSLNIKIGNILIYLREKRFELSSGCNNVTI